MVWRKPNTTLENKHLQACVKYGGRSVMPRGVFGYGGVWHLPFINGIMDKMMYIDILKKNLRKVRHVWA